MNNVYDNLKRYIRQKEKTLVLLGGLTLIVFVLTRLPYINITFPFELWVYIVTAIAIISLNMTVKRSVYLGIALFGIAALFVIVGRDMLAEQIGNCVYFIFWAILIQFMRKR